MTEVLEAHLTTDKVSGDLTITLDPQADSTLPVSVEEWPDLRKSIRSRVRGRLGDEDDWSSFLDSDRPGERFDVRIGLVKVVNGGTIHDIDIWYTSPEDVDWEART